MCFFSLPLSAVDLQLALQTPTYTVFCWKWGIEPTNWHATIRRQLTYNNRRCCSPLGLATQCAAIHQIHLYELPPSANVSKTPPHLIAVSILDFCGSGGIRTPEAERRQIYSLVLTTALGTLPLKKYLHIFLNRPILSRISSITQRPAKLV